MRAYAVVFVSILLAELGDKTQLATLLFATDTALSRAGVLAAAAAALVMSAAVAVVAGSVLGASLDPRLVRKAASIAFIAIGVWMLVRG
jgi:putative Ca2+/H+ antiporter (TMEM165/GDT1 family)